MSMTRREAVIKMAVLMGATVVGPRLYAANFSGLTTPTAQGFSPEELALLNEIGDTIIPTTDVPGAKAAGIGAFMAMMVHDCYGSREQAAFKQGLQKIDATYTTRFGGTFVTGEPAQRTTFLNELDHEQKVYTAESRKRREMGRDDGPHFFRIMKELTVLGYFSSEIGCIQALRFTEVPGRFDGNAPYKHGEHGWFS
jgi:Gluconate 2-dehydrogenase subunit 3